MHKKCTKAWIKHWIIGVKQAWSIKNYRYVWDVSCIYLDLGSLESLLYICSFGIYCKLLRCNHLWSNPPALRVCFACTWCLVGIFESILCEVWRELLKLHRLDLRDITSGIRALVFDTSLVRSAYRLTLPTYESSVKTILLKMRWIILD